MKKERESLQEEIGNLNSNKENLKKEITDWVDEIKDNLEGKSREAMEMQIGILLGSQTLSTLVL